MRNKEPDLDAFETVPFIGETDTVEDPIGEAEKVFGEKWDSMLYYLKADMQDINTMTSFSMLKLVITQIGIEESRNSGTMEHDPEIIFFVFVWN